MTMHDTTIEIQGYPTACGDGFISFGNLSVRTLPHFPSIPDGTRCTLHARLSSSGEWEQSDAIFHLIGVLGAAQPAQQAPTAEQPATTAAATKDQPPAAQPVAQETARKPEQRPAQEPDAAPQSGAGGEARQGPAAANLPEPQQSAPQQSAPTRQERAPSTPAASPFAQLSRSAPAASPFAQLSGGAPAASPFAQLSGGARRASPPQAGAAATQRRPNTGYRPSANAEDWDQDIPF